MNTIKELIHSSTVFLRNNGLNATSYSRPHYPTCIFYFGNRSSKYHDELINDIAQSWGGNADYIKFFVLQTPDIHDITDLSGERLDSNKIQTQITDLLSNQNVFSDMNRIALYCLVDTTEIESDDVFEKWYSIIRDIEAVIGVSTLSMLMVILNESLQLMQAAKGIKNRLLKIYEDDTNKNKNTHLYNSVFVLGNRLKNGSFVKIDPDESEYANFNLFADIIVLSNTNDNDYDLRRSCLYGDEKPALTAAYGFVQKPMEEIVMISLKIISDRLKGLLSNQTIDSDCLMSALRIHDGKSDINERFYNEIKSILPSNDFLNWLPGMITADKSYSEANEISCGCLQLFLEKNHMELLRQQIENQSDDIRQELVDLLADSLNAAQLVNGVSKEVMQIVFDKAEMSLSASSNLPVNTAIEILIKKAIASEMRKVTMTAIDKATRLSENCLNTFKKLCSELDRMAAVGEEGTRKNLTSFYGDKINRYYNDSNKLKRLFTSILNIRNDDSGMILILLNELKSIFESDPVYKLSFSEELIERLGVIDTGRRAQEFIGQELIKNLDDRLNYYSKNILRSKTLEAYMINTETTHNNLLFKYLDERSIPNEVKRTFFNTCSNDKAESIWFYTCSTDNLLI